MESILLSTIDTDILIHRIAERTVELLKRETVKDKPETEGLLTRKQALEFFKITSSTLWKWEKDGKIQAHGLGGKRYYKRSELEASLTEKK